MYWNVVDSFDQLEQFSKSFRKIPQHKQQMGKNCSIVSIWTDHLGLQHNEQHYSCAQHLSVLLIFSQDFLPCKVLQV